MNVIDEYLGVMTIAFVFATIAQLLLIWRRINNIADPLLFFALTSAFSLGLGVHAVDSVGIYARIVGYFCCLYIGFFAATGKSAAIAQPLEMRMGTRHFKLIIVTGCTLFFLVNLMVWANSGVILLSDDPSLQKSTAYASGFGFVRRINWGLGVYVMIGATYWFLWARSKTALSWLALAVLTSISGGGKGALLPMIFALGLYFLRPFRPASPDRQIPSRRILVYALLLAVIPVAAVLLIEQDSTYSALNALLVRLFYFGDILLYWGQPELRAYFSNLGILDYIRDSFGLILGMLRLTDYGTPVGNQFVQFTLPVGYDFSESLGPNLPFYVRGELYFGPWFAPVHALVIGWILGRIRHAFTSYRGGNLLHYSLAAFWVCLSVGLPVEEGLAIGQAADFLMMYLFVHVLASMIVAAAKPKNPTALGEGT